MNIGLNQTEDIKDLVASLSKAQGKMKPATFNKVNPHFRNRYADFTSCMDACRGPLTENGLSIIQFCETVNDKLTLVTMLAHVSGQWIKSHFPLNPAKMDSQSIGSAMTYAKRYSLSAMLGIVSDEEEDDDGEASHGRYNNRPEPIKNTKPKVSTISPKQASDIKAMLDQTPEDYKKKLNAWLLQKGFNDIADIQVNLYEEIMAKLKLKLAPQPSALTEDQKKEAINE